MQNMELKKQQCSIEVTNCLLFLHFSIFHKHRQKNVLEGATCTDRSVLMHSSEKEKKHLFFLNWWLNYLIKKRIFKRKNTELILSWTDLELAPGFSLWKGKCVDHHASAFTFILKILIWKFLIQKILKSFQKPTQKNPKPIRTFCGCMFLSKCFVLLCICNLNDNEHLLYLLFYTIQF